MVLYHEVMDLTCTYPRLEDTFLFLVKHYIFCSNHDLVSSRFYLMLSLSSFILVIVRVETSDFGVRTSLVKIYI